MHLYIITYVVFKMSYKLGLMGISCALTQRFELLIKENREMFQWYLQSCTVQICDSVIVAAQMFTLSLELQVEKNVNSKLSCAAKLQTKNLKTCRQINSFLSELEPMQSHLIGLVSSLKQYKVSLIYKILNFDTFRTMGIFLLQRPAKKKSDDRTFFWPVTGIFFDRRPDF